MRQTCAPFAYTGSSLPAISWIASFRVRPSPTEAGPETRSGRQLRCLPSAPIIGATKMYQLDEAIGAVDIVLSADEITRLEASYRPHAVKGHE